MEGCIPCIRSWGINSKTDIHCLQKRILIYNVQTIYHLLYKAKSQITLRYKKNKTKQSCNLKITNLLGYEWRSGLINSANVLSNVILASCPHRLPESE